MGIYRLDTKPKKDIFGFLILVWFVMHYGHAQADISIFGLNIVFEYYLSVLLFFITFYQILYRRDFNIKEMGFAIWYAVFLAFCALSVLWAINSGESMLQIQRMIYKFLVLFSVVYYVKDEHRFLNILKIQIVALSYMVVRLMMLGSLQLFARHSISVDLFDVANRHFNTVGGMLIFGVIISVYLYKQTKRLSFLIPLPFFYYILLVTGSRKSIFLSVFSLLIWYALSKGIKKIYLSLFIIGVSVVVFISYINSGLPGANMMKFLVDGFLSDRGDSSFNSRMFFINTAQEMFKRKPLFGWGLHSFSSYIFLYHATRAAHVHNNYLEILSGLGIVGFSIYYFIYLKIFIPGIKELKSKNIDVIFAVVVIISLLTHEYGSRSYFSLEYLLPLFCAYYAVKLHKQKEIEVNDT